MIAVDTSTWVAYLQGDDGEDAQLLDRALDLTNVSDPQHPQVLLQWAAAAQQAGDRRLQALLDTRDAGAERLEVELVTRRDNDLPVDDEPDRQGMDDGAPHTGALGPRRLQDDDGVGADVEGNRR